MGNPDGLGSPPMVERGGPDKNFKASSMSVRRPAANVRRERSIRFREFGLYASKLPPSTPTNVELVSTSSSDFPYSQANELGYSTALASPSSSTTTEGDKEDDDDENNNRTSSPRYEFAPQSPRPPISHVSPRWDSLAHSATVLYDHTRTAGEAAPTTSSSTGPSPQGEPEDGENTSFSVPETRDAFPPSSPIKMTNMNAIENRYPAPAGSAAEIMPVGNFSRPRRPSVRQPSVDSIRHRGANPAPSQTDSALLEASAVSHQHLWPRERGHSISSNKSASTFASLPVRPTPDLYPRDSVRGRNRQGYPQLGRPPVTYNRTESSGPSFARDPLPRMASMPSDELRSSFRSQLSASTAQGTVQTERSSVMTKSSSTTSIYGPVDDAFSVDDIMGMYEKGFRDDSPAPTDHYGLDSRPPTGISEISRRRSAMLEAMTDPLPIQHPDNHVNGHVSTDTKLDASLSIPHGKPELRDSAAIFQGPALASFLTNDVDGNGDSVSKHDSGKLLDSDDDDFPMRSEGLQMATGSQSEVLDETRDQYGFRKENQYISQEQYDSWNQGYKGYMARRQKKWVAYLKESGLMTDNPNRFPQRSTKTKRFVRKGIPPEWRGAAWFYYAGGPAILAKHGGLYDELLTQTAKDVDNEAIERDLHRTFPDNIKFRSAQTANGPNTETSETRNSQSTVTELTGNAARPNETPMISSLRRVLHAFSIYNPRIGYCQSLNFLAGLLLLFVETEEQAFWLLNIITRVYLPGTHELSLEGANVDLGVLMSALRDVMPAVWAKIGGELDGTETVKPKSRRYRKAAETTRLPPITLCMTAWFMSCFIGTLPIETTLRVWDVFFYEGSKTLFRIALAIFKLGEAEIKSVGDPMEIFQVVQTIPRRLIDANGLMEACFKRRNGFGHLSQDEIEQKRQARRDYVKLETERAATGVGDEVPSIKGRGTLFGKKKKSAEVS